MHTFFDFITHVKGIEYILALLFIVGFIIYLEILKPRPFRSLLEHGQEDLNVLRSQGYKSFVRLLGRIVSAPFLAMGYLIALSFGFMMLLIPTVIKGLFNFIAQIAYLGWRPAEAYLGGKHKQDQNHKG